MVNPAIIRNHINQIEVVATIARGGRQVVGRSRIGPHGAGGVVGERVVRAVEQRGYLTKIESIARRFANGAMGELGFDVIPRRLERHRRPKGAS